MTELFGRALALEPDARARMLDEVAIDDRELATELRSLLAADDAAGAMLRTGGLAPAPPVCAPDPGVITIPGYRITGVLGEGAMGVVLEAEQQSPRRPVAIKVLRARNPAVLARFTGEAEIMARLDHPGIARVYAAGDADGAPYLVMERVSGVTLDAHVAPVGERLALFAQVCDAIHHAHVKGVVHRDLKPSNIMVRADGRVAVLDFGIARVLDDDGARTREGELIGTPVYMSPEQARMRPDEVDTRSDVYALGVILYELVSGTLPYDVRGRSLPAVVRTICEDDPRPLGGERRGDLDAIARRALAKEAGDRYPSAAALAEDVRRFLDGRSVSARTPGAAEQVWRYARRHPRVAGAAAAAIVATIATAVTITTLWLDARAAHRAAVQSRDALELRANELTVSRAQMALVRDPTAALADLATLTSRGVDRWQVDLIAAHARALGIATRVLRAQRAETRWAERSADGRVLVAASYDGAVRVWRGGDDPRVLWRADGRAHVARMSPDGALVAAGADGGEAAIIDMHTGAVHRLIAHAHDVERLAWSADGRWLVTADDHGAAHLWWDGGAHGATLDGPTAGVQALGLCDDGTCAFAGDDRGRVTVWPLTAAPSAIAAVATVNAGASPVLGAWADSDAIAAVTEDGTVTTWHRADGTPARIVRTGGPIHDAAFGPRGAFALLGRVDGTVLLVENAQVTELGRFSGGVETVAVAPDGAWLGAAADDGEIGVWTRGGRHLALRGHTSRVRHLAFDRGGLLSCDGEGVVRAWDLAAIPPTVWHGKGVAIDHVLTTRAGVAIAIDAAGELRALAPDGGVHLLGEHGGRVHLAASFGDAVVTASGSDVALWAPGAEPVRLTLPTAVTALAVAPDATRLAVATYGGPIVLLDPRGSIVATVAGNDAGTNAIAYDRTGALLASGGQDRVVRVWRVDNGPPRALAALPGPTGDTRNVAFSPDGASLIAGSDDGAVRSWSVRDGTVDPSSLRELARHRGAVVALSLSPSGKTMTSIARDGRVLRISLTGPAIEQRVVASTPTTAIADDDRTAIIDSDGALWRWTREASSFHAIPIDASALAPLPDGHALVGLRDGDVIRVDLR